MQRLVTAALATALLCACDGGVDTLDDGTDAEPTATLPSADAAPVESEPAPAETLAPGEPVQAAIWGDWLVTDARLTDANAPVQAYGPEQLDQLDGARLSIAREAATWSGAAIEDDTAFRGDCASPQPEAVGADGVLLRCDGGTTFGPPASGSVPTMRMLGNDQLVLRWFDGVTLELERAQ